MRWIGRLPIEAMAWTAGLVLLAFYDPHMQPHLSLCPLSNMGFSFCPGCGLGRAISFLLHGEIQQSLKTHPLGIFAVTVLSYRTFQLIKNYLQSYGKSY